MTEINIRQALPRDLEALRQFEQSIVASERPFDPTLRAADVRYYELGEMLQAADTYFAIAEAGDRAVGCGFARMAPSKPFLKHERHGYLGLIYVEPEYRGRGLAQRVIGVLKDWCRANGLTELRLEVYVQNDAAVRAYEKAGFTPHVIEMRLALPD